SGRSQTIHKSSHRLGDERKTAETQQPTSATDARLQSSFCRSGNEINTTVQTATGNTDIDRKTRLDGSSEIQFLHVYKHIRHELQGKQDMSADGHDGTSEHSKNTTVTCNTSRVQQLDAEIVTSITPDQRSTSSFCRHIINKNCWLHWRTGPITEKANCATRIRLDQEQARDNATRMGLGSSEKADTRNPTDCVFTTTESVIAVEFESICTTEPFLQSTPLTVNVRIITTTIHLPILWVTNAITDITNSVPNYFTTESIFTNDEPIINNKRFPTTKQ
ncbi:MAG: hypothetical protein EZS28_021660, partial [Streblomastix strix]